MGRCVGQFLNGTQNKKKNIAQSNYNNYNLDHKADKAITFLIRMI